MNSQKPRRRRPSAAAPGSANDLFTGRAMYLGDKRQTHFARSGATMLGILSQYPLAS
jgi:hypothetical protein